MKTSTLLSVAILFLSGLLVTGSDVQLLNDEVERRLSSGDPVPVHHPPKPSVSSGGSGGTGSSGSGGSGSGGSGSSGSASSGSGSSGSGSSGSSGTSSVSGSSSSSGGSSSSSVSASSSSSSGGSGGVHGALSAVTGGGGGPAHKGTLVLLGVAAVAGVAIAAAAVPKRRIETPDHPLKGSLNRRINLFTNLAQHATDSQARPPRRGEDGAYVNADEVIV